MGGALWRYGTQEEGYTNHSSINQSIIHSFNHVADAHLRHAWHSHKGSAGAMQTVCGSCTSCCNCMT
jgi:hypothetical protein